MNILLTNDDGIHSEGLKILADTLSTKHNVLVVAPLHNMSACSHSLSIRKKINIKSENFGAFQAFSLSGSTADCIKFSSIYFKDFLIDLIVSGINRGSNIGTDTIYSGTVAGAREGAILGKRAISVSKVGNSNEHLQDCCDILLENIEKFYRLNFKDIFYNINFPNCARKDMHGIKVCKLGLNTFEDKYYQFEDGYILDGVECAVTSNLEKTDVEFIREKFITVTPMVYNFTSTDLIVETDRILR